LTIEDLILSIITI